MFTKYQGPTDPPLQKTYFLVQQERPFELIFSILSSLGFGPVASEWFSFSKENSKWLISKVFCNLVMMADPPGKQVIKVQISSELFFVKKKNPTTKPNTKNNQNPKNKQKPQWLILTLVSQSRRLIRGLHLRG